MEKGKNVADCKGKRPSNEKNHFLGTHSDIVQKYDFIDDANFFLYS